MNTPAHLIFGAAAFARPATRRMATAALIGAIAPDASLYVLGFVSLVILQIPADVVFGQLYFSEAWQQVFAIDNSVFLWTGLLALAFYLKSPALIAFAGAALLHIATDFPLHHDDGRPHFWPVTDWVFASPFSYWDSARGARWIAPLEGLACILLVLLLFRRFPTWPARIGFGTLLALELWVIRQWLVFF